MPRSRELLKHIQISYRTIGNRRIQPCASFFLIFSSFSCSFNSKNELTTQMCTAAPPYRALCFTQLKLFPHRFARELRSHASTHNLQSPYWVRRSDLRALFRSRITIRRGAVGARCTAAHATRMQGLVYYNIEQTDNPQKLRAFARDHTAARKALDCPAALSRHAMRAALGRGASKRLPFELLALPGRTRRAGSPLASRHSKASRHSHWRAG